MKYKYWLACMAQMAENIGTGKVEKLFRFAGSARVLYDMSEKELMQIPGITEADVKSVLTYKSMELRRSMGEFKKKRTVSCNKRG